MKTENRQKTLIIIAAVAVGLWIADSLVFEPLGKWWSSRQQQIADLRKQVANGESEIKREAITRSRWDGMRTNTLPTDSALAERQIISAFDRWSRDSGVEINNLQPQWKNDTDDYQTLNCRVEATGTISTLSRFLYYVESGPMGLKLESMELGTHDIGSSQMTLGIQVSGLALTQPNTTQR
jgi:Tfp pilus assembly protein PilO